MSPRKRSSKAPRADVAAIGQPAGGAEADPRPSASSGLLAPPPRPAVEVPGAAPTGPVEAPAGDGPSGLGGDTIPPPPQSTEPAPAAPNPRAGRRPAARGGAEAEAHHAGPVAAADGPPEARHAPVSECRDREARSGGRVRVLDPGPGGLRGRRRVVWWTEALDRRLTELWLAGLSGARIVGALGAPGVTKNAVIGRAHRLGLPARGSPIGRRRVPGRRWEPGTGPNGDGGSPADKLARNSDHASREGGGSLNGDSPGGTHASSSKHERAANGRVVQRLAAAFPVVTGPLPRACQWPMTDGKPWRMCGAAVVFGRPYCGAHCARAYTPRHSVGRRGS